MSDPVFLGLGEAGWSVRREGHLGEPQTCLLTQNKHVVLVNSVLVSHMCDRETDWLGGSRQNLDVTALIRDFFRAVIRL